jgi:hypothetical protein
MAGWGDDPELERLRTLIDEGWSVVEIEEDPSAPGGPSDTVHLAFHRYVEGLQEERR